MIDPLTEIDWNDAWKSQMQRSRESSLGHDFNHIWDSKEMAESFWKMSQENRDRIEVTDLAGAGGNLRRAVSKEVLRTIHEN